MEIYLCVHLFSLCIGLCSAGPPLLILVYIVMFAYIFIFHHISHILTLYKSNNRTTMYWTLFSIICKSSFFSIHLARWRWPMPTTTHWPFMRRAMIILCADCDISNNITLVRIFSFSIFFFFLLCIKIHKSLVQRIKKKRRILFSHRKSFVCEPTKCTHTHTRLFIYCRLYKYMCIVRCFLSSCVGRVE